MARWVRAAKYGDWVMTRRRAVHVYSGHPSAEPDAMIDNRCSRVCFVLLMLFILSACDSGTLFDARPQPGAAPGQRVGTGPDFAGLIDRLKPTVLNIRAGGVTRGSAFVVHRDGYLLTALHVVNAQQALEVTFDSTRFEEVVVVSRDEASDLALLKVNAGQDWQVLDIDAGRDVRLGEWLVVLGNPFGQGLTASVGVVGSAGNALGGMNEAGWIQTDASVNPGNSGGPVVDSRGQVIGVATARISLGPGVGFIVPIESGRRLLNDVLTGQ